MYKPIENNGIFPTQNGRYTLLCAETTKGHYSFAVVLNYNPDAEYGQQWDAGHYFSNIYEAVAFLGGVNDED